MSRNLSEVTRRAIVDQFTVSQVVWAGRLSEDQFLARLYDLTKMPSNDHRLENAAGDIRQHRGNFNDWDEDWVFFDSRFNLMYGSDDEFLSFLCETVHPVVRPDYSKVQELVEIYNASLKMDGWYIAVKQEISGRPVYQAVRLDGRVEIFKEPTGWEKVDRQLQEARLQLETGQSEEHFQEVGLLCRETLISVAEAAFDSTRHKLIDDTEPSKTDARRLLEALIETELHGRSNEEAQAELGSAIGLLVTCTVTGTARLSGPKEDSLTERLPARSPTPMPARNVAATRWLCRKRNEPRPDEVTESNCPADATLTTGAGPAGVWNSTASLLPSDAAM